MTDYGTYKGPKKGGGRAAAPEPSFTLSRDDDIDEHPVRPPSPRPSTKNTPKERFEPLVGENSAENYADESGCPNCGTRSSRPKALYCDACGFGLAGKAHGHRASHSGGLTALSGHSEWAFDPNRYGLFGWLETILGCIAWIVGFVSLAAFQNPGAPLTSLRIAELVMVVVFLLVLVGQAIQRWFYREIFALIYGILAVGGQCCALLVLINHNTSPGSFFVVIFFAWTVAMGVKCFWIACADLSSLGRFKLIEHPLLDSKVKLWIVTGIALFVNLVGFIVQLVILTTTFEET